MNNVNIQNIARYTILRLNQNGNSICPLKLQKILYYIQAWHMVYFGKENTLFSDVPEAWVNGPVYRKVYDTYKRIGIYDQIQLSDVHSNTEQATTDIQHLHNELALDIEQWKFLESIYKHYGTKSHDELVFLTHSQKPWNVARTGLQPFEYTDQKIDLEVMYDYYSSLHLKTE